MTEYWIEVSKKEEITEGDKYKPTEPNNTELINMAIGNSVINPPFKGYIPNCYKLTRAAGRSLDREICIIDDDIDTSKLKEYLDETFNVKIYKLKLEEI